MLSLETAKKLHAAGLQWEPLVGDWCYFNYAENDICLVTGLFGSHIIDAISLVDLPRRAHLVYWTYAPRLDQLLAEIERRGYIVDSQEDITIEAEIDMNDYCDDFFCFRVDAREAYFFGEITAEEYVKAVLYGGNEDDSLWESIIKVEKLMKQFEDILNSRRFTKKKK